jgi:hypothetical protein
LVVVVEGAELLLNLAEPQTLVVAEVDKTKVTAMQIMVVQELLL